MDCREIMPVMFWGRLPFRRFTPTLLFKKEKTGFWCKLNKKGRREQA